MKFYKNKETGGIYSFDDDVDASTYINLDEFDLLADDVVDKIINPENYLSDREKQELYRSTMPSLTRYQFKRCLLENGFKTSDIETKILTIKDEMLRELTLLGFQESSRFIRNDSSVLVMQEALGLTPDEVDAMWQEALKL